MLVFVYGADATDGKLRLRLYDWHFSFSFFFFFFTTKCTMKDENEPEQTGSLPRKSPETLEARTPAQVFQAGWASGQVEDGSSYSTQQTNSFLVCVFFFFPRGTAWKIFNFSCLLSLNSSDLTEEVWERVGPNSHSANTGRSCFFCLWLHSKNNPSIRETVWDWYYCKDTIIWLTRKHKNIYNLQLWKILMLVN